MSHDDIHDQANPRRDAARLAREVEVNDVKWLMGSKQGRRVMWRRLERAGVFRTSFTGNSETFFKEGMRNMGLLDIADITAHAPEGYALMLAENTKVQA